MVYTVEGVPFDCREESESGLDSVGFGASFPEYSWAIWAGGTAWCHGQSDP